MKSPRRVILWVVVALALTAPMAGAEESDDRWVPVASSADGDKFYVDMRTVTVENGIVSMWVNHVFHKDEDHINKLFRLEIQCDKAQSGVRQEIVYRKDGTLTQERFGDDDWYGVVPDSIGEAIYEFVCPRKKSRNR